MRLPPTLTTFAPEGTAPATFERYVQSLWVDLKELECCE